MKGRLLVSVPDVLGVVPSTWAEPCVPLAGPTGPAMGIYLVPPIGTGVWVEFEHGNQNRPIWVGCRWGGNSDVPPLALASIPGTAPNILIQSLGQNVFVINDLQTPAGGLMLKSAGGASIIVNDTGIYIQNGKGASITLVGPTLSLTATTVNINNGALTIV